MTQVKDISDDEIYDAITAANALNEVGGNGGIIWPYDILPYPEKVTLQKMDRMVDQGKLDYGVSLRTAWIVVGL